MRRSQTLAPLRERGFRFYFLSRTANLVGGTMVGLVLTSRSVRTLPRVVAVVAASGAPSTGSATQT